MSDDLARESMGRLSSAIEETDTMCRISVMFVFCVWNTYVIARSRFPILQEYGNVRLDPVLALRSRADPVLAFLCNGLFLTL